MWKCPKCGREFSRQTQDHYCVKPETIDAYIDAQDEAVQPRLREVCAILRAEQITGKVCGIQAEAIADPRMKRMRQLDKLVDELARGWPVEKVTFAGLDSPRLL